MILWSALLNFETWIKVGDVLEINSTSETVPVNSALSVQSKRVLLLSSSNQVLGFVKKVKKSY